MIEKKIKFLIITLAVALSITFGMAYLGLDSFADPD